MAGEVRTGRLKSYSSSGGYGYAVPDEGGSDVLLPSSKARDNNRRLGSAKPGDKVEYTLVPNRAKEKQVAESWRLIKQ